jgi:hypothetical protein
VVAGSRPAGRAISGRKSRIGSDSRSWRGREFASNYRSDRSLTGHQKYFFANHSRHFDRR